MGKKREKIRRIRRGGGGLLLMLPAAACGIFLYATTYLRLPSEMVEFPTLPQDLATRTILNTTVVAEDSCMAEYTRVTASRTTGLTTDDLERSRAYLGNRKRLAIFADKLRSKEPVNVVVNGGSISLGHGVHPNSRRYSDQLEAWLNEMYALHGDQEQQHRVFNMGSHGADMCAMAKRINLLDFPDTTDMFILEFGINDYQGQDHKIQVDFKADVFFDGFREIALCAETVVHHLLTTYPNAAVMFLEFQTAILTRKTAQLLHMGVAQHYQIPVISYADAMFPDYLRLADKLKPYNYSVPFSMNENSILPFPHGCAPCRLNDIFEQFRDAGCMPLCVFMLRSGLYDGDCDVSGQPCYVPLFAHDDVHPSAMGHQIARDLIAEAIASTGLASCRGVNFSDHFLPVHSGWMVGGGNYQEELRRRSDFVLVKDTMEVFANKDPLLSDNHTLGFELQQDQFGRSGWIATNPTGGESITFKIDLPVSECYAVFLSVLKSYENVGTFNVTVDDSLKKTKAPLHTVDCLWKPRISVPYDIQLTPDDVEAPGCTGKCNVTVTTNPKLEGRGGDMNQVKIMTLSARKCIQKVR